MDTSATASPHPEASAGGGKTNAEGITESNALNVDLTISDAGHASSRPYTPRSEAISPSPSVDNEDSTLNDSTSRHRHEMGNEQAVSGQHASGRHDSGYDNHAGAS